MSELDPPLTLDQLRARLDENDSPESWLTAPLDWKVTVRGARDVLIGEGGTPQAAWSDLMRQIGDLPP